MSELLIYSSEISGQNLHLCQALENEDNLKIAAKLNYIYADIIWILQISDNAKYFISM